MVGPDTVHDDQIVPGGGIRQGNQTECSQEDPQPPIRTPGHRQCEDHYGRQEEHDEEDGVRHVVVKVTRVGYQMGILAMAPALAATAVVSLILVWPSPLESVAEKVMQWTPVGIATFLLLNVHGPALIAASLGSVALYLLVGGLAGALGTLLNRKLLGVAVSMLIMLLLVALAFPLYDRRPTVVLAAAYGLALAFIRFRRFAPGALTLAAQSPILVGDGHSASAVLPPPSETAPHASVKQLRSRRSFLSDSAIILVGVATTSGISALEPLWAQDAATRLLPFNPPEPGPSWHIAGLTPFVTPTSEFYVNDKDLLSPIDGDLRLRIGGRVDRPFVIDMADLRSMPTVNSYITMECVDNPVGGPLIGNALWTGVPLSAILRRALPHLDADVVVLRAADGYVETLPVDRALSSDVLLAYGMNGRTLTRDHGYPARILIPGLYGFKSVKWITSVEVQDGGPEALWETKGWTRGARIRTTTRIDVAVPERRAHAVGVHVAGIAFGGDHGISRVEVRANRGRWREARLRPTPGSPNTWVQWQAFIPARGEVSLEARAADGLGIWQAETPHGAYPAGASGYATRTVRI